MGLGLANAYTTPAALRFAAANNLQSLNQNLLQAIGGVGQQGFQNRINLLGAMTGGNNALTNLANVQQAGRLGAGGFTQTNRGQSSLLDAFAPLASILSGTGQSLGGLAMLSGAGR